ncbi:hypothetical protein K0M31_008963 [Melipona bicolor]|uniref:Uncharacterized protein n=1 Tax=Melipona bicolor TaxID=60889 RepID=A0AA40KK82_9HYME|nr:hypothetical protein K0M31_008963 [Melipona bicolor]
MRPTHRRYFFGEIEDLYWLNEPFTSTRCFLGTACKVMPVFAMCEGVREGRPGFGNHRSDAEGVVKRAPSAPSSNDRGDSQVDVEACDVFWTTGTTGQNRTTQSDATHGHTEVGSRRRFTSSGRKMGKKRRERHSTFSSDDIGTNPRGRRGTPLRAPALVERILQGNLNHSIRTQDLLQPHRVLEYSDWIGDDVI